MKKGMLIIENNPTLLKIIHELLDEKNVPTHVRMADKKTNKEFVDDICSIIDLGLIAGAIIHKEQLPPSAEGEDLLSMLRLKGVAFICICNTVNNHASGKDGALISILL